jgi:hypothetical protein
LAIIQIEKLRNYSNSKVGLCFRHEVKKELREKEIRLLAIGYYDRGKIFYSLLPFLLYDKSRIKVSKRFDFMLSL